MLVGAAGGQDTPNPKKQKGESGVRKALHLGQSSPASPHALTAYGVPPQKAKPLSKHFGKVKTFVSLNLATSKEVLHVTAGREHTNHDFGEILGRNVERMVTLPLTRLVINLFSGG